MEKLNIKNHNFNKGFTLVESLVAIAILMVAIAGPMYLSQKGLATTELSTNQMIASYLAQDGMEAVKNIRDEVALSSTTIPTFWLEPFKQNGCMCADSETQCNNFSTKYCNIDTTQTDLLNAIVSKEPTYLSNPLRIKNDFSVNFLGYTLNQTDEASSFRRYINISTTTLPGEAVVRMRVSWNGGKNTIDIKDYIYNYSNNPNITNNP